MKGLIFDYRPDIMVVCARKYDKVGSSYRMLKENYKDMIKSENVFWTEFSDDRTKMIDAKRPIVEKIINRIQSI